MSDLGGAIDLVVQRISKHGAASFNEENTAVVLIEPVPGVPQLIAPERTPTAPAEHETGRLMGLQSPEA